MPLGILLANTVLMFTVLNREIASEWKIIN